MNSLDELLDAAAADLERAVARVPIAARFAGDDLNVADRRSGYAKAPARRARQLLVVASAVVALVVAGLILIQRRPADQPAENPTSSTPTSTTTPLFDSAHVPLQLTHTPAGYAAAGQTVRPAAAMRLRSAVFVQRDAQGATVAKVLARVGDISLLGTSEGTSQPGFSEEPITPPPNLSTATSGTVFIEQDSRLIHVQFALGGLGNLMLDSYHLDASTDLATVAQMQQIAASLMVPMSGDLTAAGPLPDGWQVATLGVEPWVLSQTFFQAFEVDVPDGGNKILISNIMTNDAGVPYWEMDETLEPLDVRGHAGFVSTHTYASLPANAPVIAGLATAAATLIWPEASGHWVILRGDGMTSEQLLAIANQLTPANTGEWQQPGAPTPTTTTA